MASANLSQIYAARPLTGAASARTDLYYVADVSEPVVANKDKAHTRDELLRALAESARLGISKYIVPFLPDIVGLTGGGSSKLDGILTGLVVADVQIPFCVDISPNDDHQRWKLRARAGGEVADGAGLVDAANALFVSYIFVRIQ